MTGGDRSGRFLVGRGYASTDYVEDHLLLIWDGGDLRTVDMPGGDEAFTDVNGSGVAVGHRFGSGDTNAVYISETVWSSAATRTTPPDACRPFDGGARRWCESSRVRRTRCA